MRKKIIIIGSFLFILLSFVVGISATSNEDASNEAYNNNDSYLLDSPLFTSQEKDTLYDPVIPSFTDEGFTKVLDNPEFTLYIDDYSLAFRLFNKQTNYTWSSDVKNIDDYDMNNAQKKYARSAFLYYYRTSEGVVKKRYATDSKIETSYTVSDNRVTFSIDDEKSSIRFQYYIELVNSKLVVHLDNSSIEEYGDNLISNISFYQYFGSVYRNTIDGYFFLPSGNGGLIRFNEYSAINSSYSSSFFGTDFNRVQNREDETLTLPIYGYAHYPNHNACLVEVTSGVSYSSINYTPSNVGQNFNMMYTSFSLREAYVMAIPGSDSILIIPEDRYEGDIELQFDFLSDSEANYVGMANKYKENLIDRDMLKQQDYEDNVHLDFFGLDTSDGLIFKKNHEMTTTSDIVDIAAELSDNGIDDILYTLRGFNKGGYSEASSTNYKFNSSLGSLNDLDGLNYYIYYNPTESYKDEYEANTNTLVDIYNTRGIVEIEKYTKYKLITNIDSSFTNTKKALETYENIAIDGFCNYLYGDSDSDYTREEVYSKITEVIDTTIPMFKPNSYLLGNTESYLNLDLYHDRLRFITDSVPFLQIVLSGYIPYYSTYLNFSANSTLDVLKCVEYGSYPSYLLTNEESHNLSDTLSSNLYATTYSRLKDDLIENVNYINGALDLVAGNEIISREIIDSGVVKVGYSNNVSIIVNYTAQTIDYNGISINSMDYGVE